MTARFFLDTSVLFAAVYSATGGSARLITDAVNDHIRLVISDDVADELRHVFANAHPHLSPSVETILSATPFEVVTITPTERDAALAAVDDPNDAHVVAAARLSGADALVSLDRKHLLGRPRVSAFAGMPVITPGDAIARYAGAA